MQWFSKKIRARVLYNGSFILFIFCFLGSYTALAMNDVEFVTTYRGAKKSLALPPIKMHCSVGATLNIAEIQKEISSILSPLLATWSNENEAALRVFVQQDGGNKIIRLTQNSETKISKSFILPAQKEHLQRSILGYAQSLALRNLQNPNNFSGITWKVNTWIEAKAGEAKAQNIHGSFWKPSELVSGTEKLLTKFYSGRTLLSFGFTNTSPENVYIYLLNATNTGQILPILAPQELLNAQNTLLAGKSMMLEDIYLELGSEEETVYLIISREPLLLAHWQQDDFHTPKHNFMHTTSTPQSQNWSNRKIIFLKK